MGDVEDMPEEYHSDAESDDDGNDDDDVSNLL